MQQRLALRLLPLLAAAAIALAVICPQAARADVPYQTYYKDQYHQQYPIQAAYRPAGVLARELLIPDPAQPGQVKLSPLNQPQDLFIDARDQLYIADTNNNRIVHLDERGALVRVLDFPDSPLNRPQGLFIASNGDIYIADTGNQRIVRANAAGEVEAIFTRPDSKLIPGAFKFDPIKLVADQRGFLYIATLGGYQGLLQLDSEGQFQGFFGANKTSVSLADSIKRLLYTREMYEREISKLPGSITSVDQNAEGFIYTVTKEVQRGQLKKLNIAGLDQLAGKGEFADLAADGRYGETIRGAHGAQAAAPQLNDLAVDGDGNITVVDARLNIVSQYDSNGNLLFYWGGTAGDSTAKLGIVKMPAAIANDSANQLYILDSENNVVQKYELSEFGALVHRANSLTQDGRYEESEPLWQEVYRQNAFYTPAVLGLAKAAYKRGDYAAAARLFRDAGWPQGYSDAFWQNRLVWFQRHFGVLMNAVIGALLLLAAARFAWRKLPALRKHAAQLRWRADSRFLRQLGFIGYLAKRPLDGFYGIRYEGKAGLLSGSLVFVAALASYGYMRSSTNFIYDPSIIVDVGAITPMIQFSAVWLAFIVANDLTSSLSQGEGRFRDVYAGSAYALFPFIVVGIPLTVLSGAMTLNEEAIYRFLEFGLYGWVGLLLFWQVQGVQNFSVWETVKNLLLTGLTMLVLAILLFIGFSLTSELGGFIYSVYQEVAIR